MNILSSKFNLSSSSSHVKVSVNLSGSLLHIKRKIDLNLGCTFRKYNFESKVFSCYSFKLMRDLSTEHKLIWVLFVVRQVLLSREMVSLTPWCLPSTHNRESGFNLKFNFVNSSISVWLGDVSNSINVVQIICIYRQMAFERSNSVFVSPLIIVNSSKFSY